MKIVTTLTLSLFAFGALAQGNLSDMKRMANDSISREMSSLESNKTCINGAKTVDAFKACKYDLNESQKMQKEETKEVEKKVDVINEDAMQKKEEVIDKKEDLDKSY
jgi:hypothetical protein